MKAFVDFFNNKRKEIKLYSKDELKNIIKENSSQSLEQIKLLDKFESLSIDNNTYYVHKLNFNLLYKNKKNFNFKFYFQNLIFSIFFPLFTLLFFIFNLENDKMINKLPHVFISSFFISLIGGIFLYAVNPPLLYTVYFLSIFSSSFSSFLSYDKIKNYSYADYMIDISKIKSISIFNEDSLLDDSIESLKNNSSVDLDLKKELNFSFNSLEKFN